MTHSIAVARISAAREAGATELDLSNLELTEVPEEIRSVTSLTNLDLGRNRLTSLPDWFGSLLALERLILQGNAFVHVPELLASLALLEGLNLSDNEIRQVPSWITKLPRLTGFGIGGNPLANTETINEFAPRLRALEINADQFSQVKNRLSVQLVDYIGMCFREGDSIQHDLRIFPNLKSLRIWGLLDSVPFDLSEAPQLTWLSINCNLSTLPENLGQLAHLKALDVSNNQLSAVPDNLGRLRNLHSLDVSNNLLSSVPESLGQMRQLRSLDLSSNKLATLPESLGHLAQLQFLYVSNNQLTKLPKSLGKMGQLRSLYASNNQLTALPETIDQLVQLQSLNLSRNKLTILPECLGQMEQLQSLDLWSNELAGLPDSLEQMVQLQSLDVSDNDLAFLSESIGQLVRLQSLRIWGNRLTALPESIGQLVQLQTLYAWGNRLTTLPESFGQLAQLQYLDVSRNRLTALPESLGELVHLLFLDVSYTQLTALPNSLGQLMHLQSLDAAENQLTVLPESLGQLMQLQFLNVSNNQLTALPENLGRLAQLQSLNISGNQVSVLPNGVENLHALSVLDASNNQLSALPRWLRKLPLTSLWLQENQRLGIPAAVLGKYLPPHERRQSSRIKSPAAILDAYFSAQELDGQPLDEIKLVLVGRGATGKTTIAHRLIHNRFKRGTRETQGVDISRWPLRCGEREIDVNVWDFAGQVVTHSTHQFFLSESSVYVLVLTGREDTQKTDADYWLRLIRAFATDEADKTSPVILILNKYVEHPFKVDRNALREKYPFIADFIETDCKSGLGIEELRQRLAEVIWAMPIVQQRFKLAWWRIKERLEKAQRKHNYLPYATFQEICAKEGENDAERQRFLADVFHALGIALNYGSDERLRNATVLNPRWVTASIYKLLRQGVPDDGSAELTLERVAKVLPDEPDVMRAYLVELMRRFDLAFPVNEHGERWLVPQRLPAEQPDLGDEWQGPIDATHLRYSYPVIPEGLLPRFISRTYPLSQGEDGEPPLPRWANGVVLQDRGARALVRVDSEERRIDVVCKGPKEDRLFLLGVIQADFRTLHEQIAGLDQIEELEVEGYPGVFVLVQGLLADELKGNKSYAPTSKGTIPLDATAELDRLSEPPARRDEWRPRVFISYSSSDARLKDELLTRLKPMRETQGLVETWDDRCITPGEDWDGVIRKELEIADVILLLVSAKFLASDYIRGIEVEMAVRRASTGEALVIPIILENCGYQHEDFGRANALPRKGRPVRDHKPQREAWYQIEEELRTVFTGLRTKREQRLRLEVIKRGVMKRLNDANS